MALKLQFKRNEEEKEAIVKCFIFPSLFRLDNDNLIWSNIEYDLKYQKPRDSSKSREFIILNNENEEEIGCCVLKYIDFENQNIMVSTRMFLKNDEIPEKIEIMNFLQSVEDFIFNHFDITKIYGSIDADNPYVSILEKLSFIREGCLKENFFKKGKYINQYIYSKFFKRE